MTRERFFREISFYNQFRLTPVLYKAEADLTPEELAKLDRLLEAKSVLASRKIMSFPILLSQVDRELYRLVEVERDHPADQILDYEKARARG